MMRTTLHSLSGGLIALGIWVSLTAAFGRDYHVATTGSDANAGSLSAPYRTVQKAADRMVAGDVCLIHAGTYRETVKPANSGREGSPLVFTAYQDDEAVINGCESLTGWTNVSGSIYKTTVKKPVKDLFVNGQYMLWARHPNIPYDPLRGFDLLRPTRGTANPPAGVDWTGVTVVEPVNKEGWWNKVSKQNRFVPMPDDLAAGGWLMGVPGLIDSEGEWCWKDGILYLWTPGGKNPATLLIEAKERDCGFDLTERDHIQIKKLTVLGATINLNLANHCALERCKVLYVSSFFEPATFNVKSGDLCAPMTTNLQGKGLLVNGHDNTIRDCEIAHSWGNCLTILGTNTTVYNCDIYDANWLGFECAALALNGGGHVIRNNTLHDTQRAALLCTSKFSMVPASPPSLITLNEIYRTGTAKTDNGGIYCFMTDSNGTVISYNWIHDNYNGYSDTLHSGDGIYLDNYSRNFVIHHNVLWNFTSGPRADGIRINNPKAGYPPNNVQIYNNTMWNCKMPINSPDKDWNGRIGIPYWTETKVYNNILLMAVTFGQAQVGNNYTGADALFVDARNHDFRLKAGTPCIDAGVVLPGITDGFIGSAPDIGAYEHGGQHWKPGRIADSSTRPSESAAARSTSGEGR